MVNGDESRTHWQLIHVENEERSWQMLLNRVSVCDTTDGLSAAWMCGPPCCTHHHYIAAGKPLPAARSAVDDTSARNNASGMGRNRPSGAAAGSAMSASVLNVPSPASSRRPATRKWQPRAWMSANTAAMPASLLP